MKTQAIHQAVKSYYQDIWNLKDKTKVPGLLRHDFSFCGALGHLCTGHEAFESYVDRMHAALSDYVAEVIDLVAEDDKAFARMHYHGFHSGMFFGHPPTGKLVSWEGAVLFTFRDDKIATLWAVVDERGLLKLLDAQA
ncbi:MAG: ester cyclase [Verrucomicrobiales bacterium]|nr:ester cyclase [Verrucomicrobiales bacterium]